MLKTLLQSIFCSMHRHGSTAVFDIDKNIKELSILNHNLSVFHGSTVVPHVLKLFLALLLVPLHGY